MNVGELYIINGKSYVYQGVDDCGNGIFVNFNVPSEVFVIEKG